MINLDSCLYTTGGKNTFTLRVNTLQVINGSKVYLVGPSGSGKTTLLKALAGLLENCSGHLSIDGDIVGKTQFPVNRKNIMFLSQDLGLWPHLTCGQHIAFVTTSGKSLRLNGSARWLELVGLQNKLDSRPNQLSGGEQKRLALGRALAAEPQYLFLDEPFANIDPVLAQELTDMIDAEHSRRKFTLIQVTHHYLGLNNENATILVVNQGQIVQRGTLAEISHNPVDRWTHKWAEMIK